MNYFRVAAVCCRTDRSGRRSGKSEVAPEGGGTAKALGEEETGLKLGLYKVFARSGLRGKFGLIPNCLEPQSHRSSSKGTRVWPEGLSE